MNPVTDRMDALRRFVAAALHTDTFGIAPASADASFRSYWRATRGAESWVAMDAPPTLEDVRPWLDIGQRLAQAGLHTPAVLARDLDQGFLLLEDFGTRTLLPELTATNVDAHYAQALDAVLTMQREVGTDGLPRFDAAWATQELELMPTWFLQRHLGLDPGCAGWDALELAFRHILTALAEQPQRFMHRDFHSRNLMVVAQRNPGIIDFQGAMLGPIAYDPASLLRDCYVEWPQDRVMAWAQNYRQRLVDAGICKADDATFLRWFDLTGLQRHLKVLGIFCRLYYRDGKAQYLNDLPLVLRYVLGVTRRYREFGELTALLERAVAQRDLTRPRLDVHA
jgi:aminoglycoside/choline kinase family phosphotransferase